MSFDASMEAPEPGDAGLDADLRDATNLADAASPEDAAALEDAASLEDAAALEDAAQPDAEPSCAEGTVCVLSAVQECLAGQLLAPISCDKGCADGACNTACDAAQQVIDQSQADDRAVVGSPTQWQTFKVAQTGVLTALELRPNVYSEPDEPQEHFLTLAIYVGTGTTGERIARQEYTLAAASSSPWHTFELASPVPLQAEQTYTWAIEGAKSVYYATSDVYPGGHAWSSANRDMTFRLHAASCH